MNIEVGLCYLVTTEKFSSESEREDYKNSTSINIACLLKLLFLNYFGSEIDSHKYKIQILKIIHSVKLQNTREWNYGTRLIWISRANSNIYSGIIKFYGIEIPSHLPTFCFAEIAI